jgi:hypothetical protein
LKLEQCRCLPIIALESVVTLFRYRQGKSP